MANSFNIVYKGKILEGHDFDGVKSQLVKNFALSPEKAEQLLKSKRMTVKRNLDREAAKKFGTGLKKAGLDVVLTRYISPEPKEQSPVTPMEEKPTSPKPEEDAKALGPGEPETAKKTKLPFDFSGTGSEYFKIWVVNTILSIITLGIYSAWAKVRRKQYFYGNTRLQSTSFEYLADPVKILKGRIIVAVFFILYSVISEFFPMVGAVLSLMFLGILPWLVIRALSFNARNSAYRNIRFGFDGTMKEAVKAYLLWPILVPFTLGLIFPYVYFRQKKFIVENSSYGTTRFTFKARPGDYYRVLVKGIVPIVLGIALLVGTTILLPFVSGLVGLIFYLYLFAYFSVRYTNLLYNSTKLSANGFKADLKPMEYLVLVATNTLGIVLTLGIFYPWARVRALRYKLDHLQLVPRGDLNNFIALEQAQVSALGEGANDFLDLDIGL